MYCSFQMTLDRFKWTNWVINHVLHVSIRCLLIFVMLHKFYNNRNIKDVLPTHIHYLVYCHNYGCSCVIHLEFISSIHTEQFTVSVDNVSDIKTLLCIHMYTRSFIFTNVSNLNLKLYMHTDWSSHRVQFSFLQRKPYLYILIKDSFFSCRNQ